MRALLWYWQALEYPHRGPVGSSALECYASKAALSLHAPNQGSIKCMYELLWMLSSQAASPQMRQALTAA